MGTRNPPPPSTTRDHAIDQARGVASLIMIQGHAFHAWVAQGHKGDASYLFTRVFARFPLPAFLVLAGAAVAYRLHAAAGRGESASSVQSALLRRGLQVTAIGYLVNLTYAILDGADGLATLLRADVLQVIGLSIALLGACVGRRGTVSGQRTAVRALVIGLLATGMCAPLSAWASENAHTLPWPGRALLAPLVDVPGLTQMPLIPLFSWTVMGFVAGHLLAHRHSAQRDRFLLLLVAFATCGLVGGEALQARLLGDDTLSRAHPAVVGNVLAYGARGLLLLGLSPLLVRHLPERLRGAIESMGRASLWAYVFHIPLCYGRLGLALRGKLSVAEATPYVMGLVLLSYVVVQLKLGLGTWSRRRRQPEPVALPQTR